MAKLPGLFAKLLGNYGDDIARGVANYGDDVLGAVANYGDDAARAVANYGDDVAGLVANNAGRAVMSPELLSDDFLDAVDDFARYTPTLDTTSILDKYPSIEPPINQDFDYRTIMGFDLKNHLEHEGGLDRYLKHLSDRLKARKSPIVNPEIDFRIG